ncbi:DNA protecting protein DprA [Aeromicrobium sp. PE09-221]|uniref:DNA-processing protein DprA n=1 Tax=Aeromicrobium sp. PE09-221 TaxID=1898043 RepID=UPI000B666D1F|nr:DNA-processing protein DprA [Aeromicrobium sp. PE09-221]OUZ08022.1 DNA protecting protein DprA [Aeromicrobium sp. PE09-221]
MADVDESMRGARLLLSLAVEPGDPRLPPVLDAEGGAIGLLERLRSGPEQWPETWVKGLRRAERDRPSIERAGREAGLRWITPEDEEWPAQVDDLQHAEGTSGAAGAPLGLWCRGAGDLRLLSDHALAVVGARDCTTYGAEAAADIAAVAADAGFAIVSGAAFGIDASAHRGGLLVGDPGIAVLACGADLDYPRAHASLLGRIAERGVVVSEYPPGASAARSRFLARNRVIAALCDGLVVVEAARRSGSLNTLHWADRLGRSTMAVPGPITSGQSQGTHEAIRSGKAVLVGSTSDVLAELIGLSGATPHGELPVSDPLAESVLQELTGTPSSVADLARGLRIGTMHVLRALRRLERAGRAHEEHSRWVCSGVSGVGDGTVTSS